MNNYEQRHNRNLAAYERKVDALYKEAVKEAAKIGASLTDTFDASKPFSFDDHPKTKRSLEKLLKMLQDGLTVSIVNGVRSEWTLANNKNDELCRQVFGDNVGRLSKAQYRRYFKNNDKALEAFIARKENGISLSDRVWKYTGQFKEEIEMGLDLGIRSGLSAQEMAAELKTFLQHPDKLFRRVRDEHGQLHLSKSAAAYHPGRGVYRSSYKNARRLAATETNIAYRTADYTRWQQLDFVVGIEIKTSNNHPEPDICDDLKGKYPKNFKFTGWHPHCRCHAEAILKTEEEMAEDTKRIMNGKEPTEGSVNEVTADNSDGYVKLSKWIEKNASRTATSLSIPYFMEDNSKVISAMFHAKRSSTDLFGVTYKSVLPYIGIYKERDARVAAIFKMLDSQSAEMKDLEKAMLINRLKQICANITYADLKKWGVVDDNFIMSRIDRNFVVQQKQTLVSKGKTVQLQEKRSDMVVIRDKYGNEFAYTVGVGKDEIIIKATEASEALQTFPSFLREGIERISFYPFECPADDYWKIEYSPNHRSQATDGGKTSFFNVSGTLTKDSFSRYMAHEATHILDGNNRRFSNSKEWKDAVRRDVEFAKLGKGNVQAYPTKYAETNLSEDLCDSMKLFLHERKSLKEKCPNRERYLHELSKELGRKNRNR